MQIFWGNIQESEISTFAGTLILPDYMSHLQLVPFRFASQPPDRNSDQSLVLTYTAPGRIEEFELEGKDHAIDLLCYTCTELKREQIKPPEKGALWSWPSAYHHELFGNQDQETENAEKIENNDKNKIMRVFFEPVEPVLGVSSPVPIPPEKAHLSISRKELFFHREVIIAYFCSRIASLGVSLKADDVQLSLTPLGFLCSSSTICWEWGPEPDRIFHDIVHFADLGHWLKMFQKLISPVLGSFETSISENGLSIRIIDR